MTPYKKRLPVVDAWSRPYWDAAKRHQLMLPKCSRCGTLHTYFEKWCSHCGNDHYEWIELSGKAVVWSFCVFHKVYFPEMADDVPYNVAQVELAEGPRLITNLVNIPNDRIRIGMPLRVFFDDVMEDVTLIKFELDRPA